jgi:enoyl-[acyl-carrier protein] reductase I
VSLVRAHGAPGDPADGGRRQLGGNDVQGANKVIPAYSVLGPVKAALESVVRYLAYELGPKGIRVHAVSAGPIKTRASSGLRDSDELVAEAARRAPLRKSVDVYDVGMATAFLVTPYGRRLTGSTFYVDAGLNVMA